MKQDQAGWHDVGDGVERYHDGYSWTNARRPLEAAPTVPDGVGALAPEATEPARVSKASQWVKARVAPLVVLGTVAAIVVIGVVVTVAGGSADGSSPSSSASTHLEAAVDSCNLNRGASGVSLGDEGHSLVLDGKGDDDLNGISVERQACVLSAVEVPDATLNLMSTTRALDGRQTADWDGYTATWTYHPDTGLNLTLQED